ncbi:MAG TPA: DUF1684 domain-containing protein [Microlunatus sp.]
MTALELSLLDQERSWHELRAERFRQLSRPYSPLAQVGLYWLTDSPQQFPDVGGHWSVAGDQLVGYADEGDSLRRPVTQELITGTVRRSVAEAGGVVIAEFGRLDETAKRIELIKRTGSLALRIYDPEAPARTDFRGVPAYAFDPSWVLHATFDRYPALRPLTVPGAQPGLQHHPEAIGEVRFRRGGAEHSLIVLARRDAPSGPVADGHGTILFSDVTSGAETAPWRVLPVTVGEDGSGIVLDFNRAVNLPYAFNDFGTCPQPPEENHLDLAVTAGEQTPLRVDLEAVPVIAARTVHAA